MVSLSLVALGACGLDVDGQGAVEWAPHSDASTPGRANDDGGVSPGPTNDDGSAPPTGTGTGGGASDGEYAPPPGSDARDVTEAPEAAPIDVGPPDVRCDESGAVRFERHCYFALAAAGSFDAQRAACATLGAHLAAITSKGEDDVVRTFTSADQWIGLSRTSPAILDKTAFTWVTAEAQTFDGWRAGEPNGTGQCARATSDGWADWTCSSVLGAVCERE